VVAALDARGGKLLWKQARAQPSAGGTMTYNPYYGYYGQQPALVLPRMILLDETFAGNPYMGGRGATALSARGAADGRLLWETPFAAQARDRAAGGEHLACALAVIEHLDENGRVVDYQNPFGRNPGQPPAVKAVRHGTVLRLFDLAGGKAVWEWNETRTVKLADGQQPWAVQPRQPFAQVLALRAGLVVTTADEAVMLGAKAAAGASGGGGAKPAE
jgi:outer membrane protein assembly factor BamB